MIASATAAPAPVSLQRQLAWWIVALPLVMTYAIVAHSLPVLNWVHVLSGILWTGADLFLGFIIGPVMRRLEPPQRAAVIAYLVPKTLLYFPVASLTTSTAGWYLASWLGWTSPVNPEFPWIVAALTLVTLMTIVGLGIMLPNNLRIWMELRAPEPDRSFVIRLNRINIRVAAAQGLMQVAIVVVMSHFVVG
jgi:uncharacterized membrane protein